MIRDIRAGRQAGAPLALHNDQNIAQWLFPTAVKQKDHQSTDS